MSISKISPLFLQTNQGSLELRIIYQEKQKTYFPKDYIIVEPIKEVLIKFQIVF